MLAAEALCAVTGIFPKPPVKRVQGDAAEGLPRASRAAIREFLDAEKPAKFRLYPCPSHAATLDKLTTPIAPDDAAELVAPMGGSDLAQEYLLQLSNAREYVRSKWPSLARETPTGVRILEPGSTAMGEAWSILAIIDSFDDFLQEIASRTLTASQVEAFATVYPGLYDMLLAQLQEELVNRVAKKKSYTVPWPQERVIRLLMRLPVSSSISEAPQSPARMAKPDIQVEFRGAETRGQRLESDVQSR